MSAGHKSIVQLILESMEHSRADRIITNHADENGEAPIHVAARCGSTEIMELLIIHGANLGLVDGLGKTCLHCASQSGHASCLALALDSGADDYLEVLSHDGFTPLHLAIRFNKTECVKLLLESGADVSTEAGNGQSVYGLASKQRNEKILALLDQYDDLSDDDSYADSRIDGENIFHSWKECAISPTNPKYSPSTGGLVSPENLTPPHPNANEIASFARRAPLHSVFTISPIVGTNLQFPHDDSYITQQPHRAILDSPHRDHDPRMDRYPSDGGKFHYGNETWLIYFTGEGFPYFYNADRNWSTWIDPRFSEPNANIHSEKPSLHMNGSGTMIVADESRQSTPIPPINHKLTPISVRTPTSPAVPLNLISKIASESAPDRFCENDEHISANIPSIASFTEEESNNESRKLKISPNASNGIVTDGETSKRYPQILFNSTLDRVKDDDAKIMELASPKKVLGEQMESIRSGSGANTGESPQVASNLGSAKSRDFPIADDDTKDAGTRSVLLAQIMSRSAIGGRVIRAAQASTKSEGGGEMNNMLLNQIKSHSSGTVGPSRASISQNLPFASRSNLEDGHNTDSEDTLSSQIDSHSKLTFVSDYAEQSSASQMREKLKGTSTTPSREATVVTCSMDSQGSSSSQVNPTDDPGMAKYFKMKAVGIPMEAILHKMKQDGVETERINSFQSSAVTASTAELTSGVNKTSTSMRSPAKESKAQLKDTLMQDDTLKKFMRMASVGVPAQAVVQKMKQEGVNESKIDAFKEFHGLVSSTTNALPPPTSTGQSSADRSQKAQEAVSPTQTRSTDQLKNILMQDETINKFMRMAAVGVPAQAVAQKMHQECIDKSKIELFNEFHGLASTKSNLSARTPLKSHSQPTNIDKVAAITKEDLEKDDTLSKYLKMKEVGVPIAAVATKMAQDGIDNEKIHMFGSVFGLKTTSSSRSPKLSPKKPSPKPPGQRERRRASKALQKIHWTAVAEEKLQNSLWASESIEIDDSDIERFESLFSASPTEKGNVGQKTTTRKNSTVKKQSSVIDPKRAVSVIFILSSFPADYSSMTQSSYVLHRTILLLH